MKALIRILSLTLLVAIGLDYNGIQPDFIGRLIATYGNTAYYGLSLIIAWLAMPTVQFYIDD